MTFYRTKEYDYTTQQLVSPTLLFGKNENEVCVEEAGAELLLETQLKNISSKKDTAFNRLNEVWGDDEDGEYAKLYQHHAKLKSNAR